jgi:hypothetical protein
VLLVVGGACACLIASCLGLGLLGLTADDAPSKVTEQTTESPAAADDPKGRHLCLATAMVRVCRGPNPADCMLQTATGSGAHDNRDVSAQMALTACRGSVIAMGGSAVCNVACSTK